MTRQFQFSLRQLGLATSLIGLAICFGKGVYEGAGVDSPPPFIFAAVCSAFFSAGIGATVMNGVRGLVGCAWVGIFSFGVPLHLLSLVIGSYHKATLRSGAAFSAFEIGYLIVGTVAFAGAVREFRKAFG